MILRKLRVVNFRQLYGETEIHFAPPGHRNVTVVLGQNGAGKSTLLNAFLWCLYERVELENPNIILSHKAAQEAQVGETVDVEVSLLVDSHGRTYSISRSAKFRKSDGGAMEQRANDLDVKIHHADGRIGDAEDAREEIRRLLPSNLSRFFFFRGEDMEHLALQSNSAELADGVSDFLDFTLIDKAIRHLKATAKDFENELSKLAASDVQAIQAEIEQCDLDLQSAQGQLAQQQQNNRSEEAVREQIEQQLATVEAIRPLIERKQSLKLKLETLTEEQAQSLQRIADAVSASGYLLLADDALASSFKLAEEAVQRGELPARIKPRFIDDLLEKALCICNRQIGDAERQVLQEWKAIGGLAAMEEAISTLRSDVGHYRSRADETLSRLEGERSAWAQQREAAHAAHVEYSNLESQLEGKIVDIDFPGLHHKRKQLENNIIEGKTKAAQLDEKVKALQRKLDELREERKRRSKHEAKSALVERRFETAQAVTKALEEMRGRWLGIVQEYLDGQLRENWKNVTQLDRLVEFTRDFHLSIKERGADGDWHVSAPSSANLRVLSLSFVTALIHMAKEMADGIDKDGMAQGRHQFFRGGLYPLVMDAPFATMDQHFKISVPRGLREATPQVVLLTNYDQWHGEIEGSLAGSVGRAYVLQLHTTERSAKDQTVRFRDKDVDYVIRTQEGLKDWSVGKEID